MRKNFWEEDSLEYDLFHKRLDLIIQVIRKHEGRAVFDIGCSTGIIGKAIGGNYEYFGCDVSNKAVGKNVGPNIKVCDLNTEPMPFENKRFDFVIASGIVEYLVDIDKFLSDVRKRLSKKSILIVTYFNMNHISRIGKLLRNKSFQMHPLWRNSLSPRDFENKLKSSGYFVVEKMPLNLSFRTAKSIEKTTSFMSGTKFFCALWYLLAHQLIFVCKTK